jgi:flagellar hook-associated protein 1 FlgK
LRRAASSEAENNGALKQRASDALSAATGVNLDAEMARLLELERSYQASSRIITTIDAMYSALFQALR